MNQGNNPKNTSIIGSVLKNSGTATLVENANFPRVYLAKKQ